MYRVHPATVTLWIKSGALRGFRTPGGHYRVRAEDLPEVEPAEGGGA